MKTIKKIILSIVIINVMFLENIYAETKGDYNSGAVGVVTAGYDTLWRGNYTLLEVRATLVDKNGNKVNETRSIDYGYSNVTKNGKPVTQKNNPNSAFYTMPSGDFYYDYKYGTNYGNYTYYSIKLVDKNYENLNYYDNVVNYYQDLKKVVVDPVGKFGIGDGETGDFDFTTMFMYHCGFLKKESDNEYKSINDSYWTEKRKEVRENGYYILLEPIFTTSGGFTIHGTAYEIAKSLKTNYVDKSIAVPYALTGDFLNFLGTGIYQDEVQLSETGFKNGTLKGGETNFGNLTINEKINKVANTEYAYGMGSFNIIFTGGGTSFEAKINKEYCEGNNGNEYISVDLEISKENFKKASQSGLKVKDLSTTNSNATCYDEVTYDFKDLMDTLDNENGEPFKVEKYIQLPEGKINIIRKCMIDANEQDYSVIKTSSLDFNEYNDYSFEVNILGTTISLTKKDESTPNITEPKKLFGSLNRTGMLTIVKTITYGYAEDESGFYIDSNKKSGESYIKFNNSNKFGFSNSLINQVESENINVNSSKSLYMKCKVNTKIKEPEKTKQKYETPDIQFRTIDLDNPFPARDGSSRLPGTNWLGKDNYVRTYITYNRGVRGNEVYEKEPLYKITLTPSNMVKIREYNKENDYSNINNELVCTDENNTACLSTFLVSNRYIEYDNKDGLCSRKKLETEGTGLKIDPNGIKDTDSNALANNITTIYDVISNNNDNGVNVFNYNYSNDQLKLDFNDDKILTLRDAYIYDFADKTTSFYTCADKTYENSGYMRKEQ